MDSGGGSSSSAYGAINAIGFLPTWSRTREELVLQTYGEGNDPLEAGDDGMAQLVSNDSGGGVQWCYGSKVRSHGGGASGHSSSNEWNGAGGLGKADRRSVLGSIHTG
jgi:hypothetical protein